MLWRLRDFCVNTLLKIRLWYYVKFKTSKLKGVNNNLDKDGWELTFNDEFDQGSLDRSKWRTDSYSGVRFHPGSIFDRSEAPPMYYGDDMFEFDGSIMKQRAEYNPIEIDYVDWDGKSWGKYTIPYRVGQIDSSISFRQMYGYWEIRSKITSEPGSWPAFWMVSVDEYPPEVDVYEIYTSDKRGTKTFASNFHWRNNPNDENDKKQMDAMSHRVLDVTEDFNIYAWEWQKNKMKIYYNNILVRQYSNPKTIAHFRTPMHIIINAAVQIDNGADKAKYPNYHEVDYVRVYKKK